MNYHQAERKYKALASERRLAILDYLRDVKKATVSDIAKHINLSFKSTSKHLDKLRKAGYVDWDAQKAQHYFYILNLNDYFVKHALKLF